MLEIITSDTFPKDPTHPEILVTNHNNLEQKALDGIRNSPYFPLRGLLAEVSYFDRQNGPHGLRVATSYEEACVKIAHQFNFPNGNLKTLRDYRFGAVMHDITKTAVTRNFYDSISLLNGNFPRGENGEDMRSEDFKLLCKSHTVLTPYVFGILEDLQITKKQANMTRSLARQHHNFEGPPITGDPTPKYSYPDNGIQRSYDTPLLPTANLIFSLVDIQDALKVERDYNSQRPQIKEDEIFQQLEANATPERIMAQSGNLIEPTKESQRVLVEIVMSTLPMNYAAPEPETLMWGNESFIRPEDRKGKELEELVQEAWQFYGDDILADIDKLQKVKELKH